MNRPRFRRFFLVALLAVVAGGIAAVTARADAPDVKVTAPAPGQHPYQTGTATVDTATGHVIVTLTGGWSWPTHGSDCNSNRAGAGVAVNWFDPQDRGFHVAFFNISGGVPNLTAGGSDDFGVGSTGANGLNPADDAVHPTENDTGTGAVVDITDPANFADWRGGCGVFSSDTVLVNTNGVLSYTTATVSHGNFGQATPSSMDVSGTPFNDPTPPSDPSLQGALLEHVYASKADVTMACALMYDVHAGTTADNNNGAGIPVNQAFVTAGDQAVASGATYTAIHNDDNSIQKNGGTPAGNSCPTFTFPPNFPTIATQLSASTGTVGDTVHDSATLSGASASAGGTVTYSVYSDSSCSTKVADGGTVNVTNAAVPDSNGVPFNTAGTYYWQASYSGDADNTGSLSACTDEKLVIAPAPEIDLAVTKSGSPATQELGQGNITWTIVVTNNGPDTATDVKTSDPMPAGNTYVSSTASQGSCTGGAILNCSLGTIAVGATVTVTLVTTPSTVGLQTNTVTVVGDEPETNTANNTATATVRTTGVPTPPKVFCVAVSRISPKQLFVGRKTKLTIHISRHGKAVKGIKVHIKGPKFNLTTGRSNAKGVIHKTVKLKKAGILVFTPLASKRCGTKRIGITGVFTPPVTG